MLVSAGAALTAAILLTPGVQAAPPFKPEDDFSVTNDPAEEVDKDVVNDLADEWSSSDTSDKKNGVEEDEMLPPDDQQDLSGMTEEDLTVGNDDDDILVGSEGDADSIFITSANDIEEAKADVLDPEEPVDLLAGLADDEIKEDDVIPLSEEEDFMSTDDVVEETDDVYDAPGLEENPEEETVDTDLFQDGQSTQDSELAVESPWDEQQSLQQDEESKPLPDDGLDVDEALILDGEETTALDGEETTALDGEETFALDGEETLALDGEETFVLDGEETLALDGEETISMDGEEISVSETEFLGAGLDSEETPLSEALDNDPMLDLNGGLDLDAATEYKEEHLDEGDLIPVNDDGEILSPVVESSEKYPPFAEPPIDDDSQLTQDLEGSGLLPISDELGESDVLTDEYQVDTSVQEINDSFEKALDAVQPENNLSQDKTFGELEGAANDPSQAGFFPDENRSSLGESGSNSTLNMLLVFAVLILVLFKLPKIKRWLSSNDQSSLPYHALHKRSQD